MERRRQTHPSGEEPHPPSADDPGELRLKDFSAYNRELSQQIDPETGERVQLLTRRQFEKQLRKSLKDFGELEENEE